MVTTCCVCASLVRNSTEYNITSGPSIPSTASRIGACNPISQAKGITTCAFTRLYVLSGNFRPLSSQSCSIFSKELRQLFDCDAFATLIGKRYPSFQYASFCSSVRRPPGKVKQSFIEAS